MKKTVSLLFAFIIILSALCFSVSAEASSAGKCDINGDKRVFDAAGDPEKCAEAFTETFVDYNFQLNKTE